MFPNFVSQISVYPAHSLLFAVYPVLFLFAHNQTEVMPSLIILPLLLAISAVSILLILFRAIFRDLQKGALFASFIAILFFNYGPLKEVFPVEFNLHLFLFQIGSDKLLFLIMGLLISTGFVFLVRTNHNLKKFTKTLNIISLTLVAFSLIQIIPYELQTKRFLRAKLLRKGVDRIEIVNGAAEALDIYYLIFDRYAADSTLEQVYDFDNSEFTDYLREMGFYVATESRSNYPKTFQSLASSLNIQHLLYLSEEIGENSPDQTPVLNMLNNHKVGNILKSQGYTYYHIGPYWQPTRKNPQADINLSWSYFDIDEFHLKLLQKTPVFPIFAKAKAAGFGDEDALRVEQKLSIPFMFKKLKETSKAESPKFVFAHFLLPHGPYVFDANGNQISQKKAEKIGEREGYLNQLNYTNGLIKQIVNELISADNPPIIILQADEGPCGIFAELAAEDGWGKCGEKADWTKLGDRTLQGKMRIFNAYYLPGVNIDEVLYPDITPVNSFRLIFNTYFGADYDLLPDKSYIFRDLQHVYDFVDVTDRVNYE